MKNFCILFLTILSGCSGHAQNMPANANYAMPAGKKAVLKLPYAHSITVKAWDKAELQFNTVIRTNKEELKDIHTVDVQDGSESLRIATDFKKDFKWGKMSCGWCSECDSIQKTGTSPLQPDSSAGPCVCYRVDYEVMLPPGTALEIETISGNIEAKGLTGAVKLKTISGFVDIGRKPTVAADLSFHSVTGEIYTDFDIALDKKSSAYDKKVTTSLNGGGSDVYAETVSGDIFFRKQ